MGERLKRYVYCDVCNVGQSEREDLSGWLPTSIPNACTWHGWSINDRLMLVCQKCTKEVATAYKNPTISTEIG